MRHVFLQRGENSCRERASQRQHFRAGAKWATWEMPEQRRGVDWPSSTYQGSHQDPCPLTPEFRFCRSKQIAVAVLTTAASKILRTFYAPGGHNVS